ncbi:TetR/AcrR family transcriptional regulator [Clostridium magnum]|uniref:TetR/AcrR family transcriptional regulator n=1 Tax=Clostridium magnum TaxID=33954 RepID=UPI001FA7F1C7|nr:TetR/AcrR family transcriptional regulator [Clostridium magnum]
MLWLPNKTFLNLSKERQEEIIEICVEEFSTHDYDSASLNRIIEKLGIAKGSFYRYFDNKTDLYEFLVDYVLDKKINYIKDFYEYDSGKCDMDIPRKIVYRLIEFDFIYFNYSSFILSFMNNKNLNECEIRKGKPAHCIIVDLQNKGLIRKDIDIDLIEFRLFRNLVLLRDFIIRKLNMSTEELSQGETTYRKYEKPISVIVEQYCDMLANGLKTK